MGIASNHEINKKRILESMRGLKNKPITDTFMGIEMLAQAVVVFGWRKPQNDQERALISEDVPPSAPAEKVRALFSEEKPESVKAVTSK